MRCPWLWLQRMPARVLRVRSPRFTASLMVRMPQCLRGPMLGPVMGTMPNRQLVSLWPADLYLASQHLVTPRLPFRQPGSMPASRCLR